MSSSMHPNVNDIHSFPPSSSVLVALSSLAPPSPILTSAGLACSTSGDILLDFSALDEPTTPSVPHSTSVASSPLANVTHGIVWTSGSVGTFGPLSRNDSTCWSPNSPAFPGHSDASWPGTRLPATNSLVPVAETPLHSLSSSRSISTLPEHIATLSPAQSVNSCPSSPRLRRKFKFPFDCEPTLPTSKSWVSSEFFVLNARDENTHPAPDQQSAAQENQCTVESRPPLLRQPSVPCGTPAEFQHTPLPNNLLWLKDIMAELLIDQEGFRSVQPTFKLAGYLKQARGWDSSQWQGDLVLFRPVKRQTFRFHYAPLDGLPILRRVTINGDEARDYISRQAVLNLKVNGVWMVHGSETPHSQPAHLDAGVSKMQGGNGGKLIWKFDYVVGDHSGRFDDGEKTLTPLTFSCSPWLLHLNQAKKMKFMHFVKKSVAPKLTAEKLEPPRLPCLSPKPPVLKPTTNIANNLNLWPLHRRAHSNTDEQPAKKRMGSIRRVFATENSQYTKQPDENQEPPSIKRRRRASSAGEGSRVVQGDYYPQAGNQLAKPIVPRVQLAELMNSDAHVQNDLHKPPFNLQGLSPAPRRPRAM